MRRLLLLRHAKTERSNPGGDHARVLVERGRLDAQNMGEFLKRELLIPDYALVSDAARTRESLLYLARGLGGQPPVTVASGLYLAAAEAIFEHIRAAPDTAGTLIVIGHNPGLHQLAFELGQHGARKLTAALAAGFPTCALAVIESDTDSWRDLFPANCRLVRYQTAKVLRAHLLPDLADDC